MNKNLLIITSNSSAKGGGEKYLVYIAKGFMEKGFHVNVLMSNKSYMANWKEMYLNIGINVIEADLKSLSERKLRFISAIFDFKQINKISKICFSLRPDYIIVNQQYDEDGLDYIKGALKYSSEKVVSVMHMPMTKFKNKRPFGILRGLILRIWYQFNPIKLVFVSEGAINEFSDYYKRKERLFLVQNGVSVTDTRSLTDKLKLFRNDFKTIGFVGQVNSQKNLSLLIDLWIFINENLGVPVNLLIVGDGPDVGNIIKLLEDTNFNAQYQITGWTNNPDMYFDYIDVFVMTSHFEGFPLSLIEAAIKGIPCVVTPFNGASDIAKIAPWVSVNQTYSASDMANLIMSILESNRKLNYDSLSEFKKFYSVERVCNDLVKVLDS